MDKLVKTLGIHSLTKPQVSRMAADLDGTVEDLVTALSAPRARSLRAGDAAVYATVPM